MTSGSRPMRSRSSNRVAAATAPTAMLFTRTPLRVHAAAIDPVTLLTAALAAAYTAACGIASRDAPEEMLTIAPLPWAIIGWTAYRDRNHTDSKLSAMT